MRTSALANASFALVVTFAAGGALAQDSKLAAAPAAPAASMPMDCGSGMKRHDQGAERNAPSSKSMPCAPAEAASGAKAKTKAKPAHDHAKFHKNQ